MAFGKFFASGKKGTILFEGQLKPVEHIMHFSKVVHPRPRPFHGGFQSFVGT